MKMNAKINIVFKYGLIISLPMILLSVISHVFNIQDSRSYGWLGILIFIITIYFVQKMYRQEFYQGFASYGKLLGDTCLMLIFTSAMMFVYSFIFYKYISPEFIEKILLLAEDSLYDKNFSQPEIEQSMVYIKKINSPAGLSIMSFFSTYIQGFIIALIISIINKKSKDAFSEAMKNIDETEEN